MKRAKLSYALALLCCAAVLPLTAWSVSRFFVSSGDGNMQVSGWTCLRYFTVLSNVLAALTALTAAPYCVKSIRRGGDCFPRAVALLRLAGTCAVTVTLLVVLVFLGPLMGYGAMFAGGNLYLHLICPLLALASFCFFEGGGRMGARDALWGALPVLLYAVVYLAAVVICGVWEDFYSFNMNGLWYVSFPAIASGSYLLSLLLCRARGRAHHCAASTHS